MATIEDRDRLFNSGTDPVADLSLTLEMGANFRHSTEALLACKNLQHVTIEVEKSFSLRWQMAQDEIFEFFRALGGQCGMKSLRIFARNHRNLGFSSSLLVEVLKNSKQLELLKVNGLTLLLDSPEAWLDLADTFRNHPCLSEIIFARSSFRGVNGDADEDTQPAPLPELFAALFSVPKLENLAIRHCQTSSTDKGVARLLHDFPPALGQAPKLTQLELSHCGIHDGHLQSLADNLELFGNLQELSLSSETFGWKACQAVAQILAKPSNLLQFYLECRKGFPKLDVQSTNLIASALANNQVSLLQVFVLEGIFVASLAPFANMLQVHCRLEVLTIMAVHKDAWNQTEINYLLKLNKMGRYDLFHATTVAREKWMETILDARDNLHCLFYLLSANPSLCGPLGKVKP